MTKSRYLLPFISLLVLMSMGRTVLSMAQSTPVPPPAISAVPSKVTRFPAAQVDEFFSKSGTLVPDTPGGHYSIMTIHRDKAGPAEWHHTYTDVIYILKGTATVVTGGHITDGKTTAPDEIRGTKIEGGESQSLAKGDIIIIPNDTPHQFIEVSRPFLYLTLKVR
jgi:quercetin dioxygenase-like cupin family protein